MYAYPVELVKTTIVTKIRATIVTRIRGKESLGVSLRVCLFLSIFYRMVPAIIQLHRGIVGDYPSYDKVPENAAFYGIDQDIIIPGAPQVKRYFTKHYITAFLF